MGRPRLVGSQDDVRGERLANGPAAGPGSELRDRFEAVAKARGYDDHAARLMFDAAVSSGLPVADATEWLSADITPWGAASWLAQGFASGAEASEYRRWGFRPDSAYWARRDGVTAGTLRGYRNLAEILAGELGAGRFGKSVPHGPESVRRPQVPQAGRARSRVTDGR